MRIVRHWKLGKFIFGLGLMITSGVTAYLTSMADNQADYGPLCYSFAATAFLTGLGILYYNERHYHVVDSSPDEVSQLEEITVPSRFAKFDWDAQKTIYLNREQKIGRFPLINVDELKGKIKSVTKKGILCKKTLVELADEKGSIMCEIPIDISLPEGQDIAVDGYLIKKKDKTLVKVFNLETQSAVA